MVAPIGPADHTPAVEVDPDRQITPTRTRADVGDVTGPATVGSKGRKVLPQEVLGDTCGPGAAVAAGSEPSPGLGLEHGPAHQTRNPVAAHLEASGPELLMDAWCTVEAAVPLKHRLDLGCDGRVHLGPWTRAVLPLPPVVEAAAGDSQLPAEPGHRKTVRQGIDQPKPLGGSCSFAKCAAASLKKSFSLRSSRFSFRSLASSALSSLVSCP